MRTPKIVLMSLAGDDSIGRWHKQVTPIQFRMARAALGLTVRELATSAGVHRNTIVRIEAGEASHGPTMAAVQRALEASGVVFIPAIEGVHGPAVALKWGQQEPRPDLIAPSKDGEDGGGVQALDRDLADFMTGAAWGKLSEDGRRAIYEHAMHEGTIE